MNIQSCRLFLQIMIFAAGLICIYGPATAMAQTQAPETCTVLLDATKKAPDYFMCNVAGAIGIYRPATAQTHPPETCAALLDAEKKVNDYFKCNILSNKSIIETSILLLFGIIVIVLQFIYFKKIKSKHEDAFIFMTITLIIILSAATIVADFTKEGGPVIGLFGSIVGYLLGAGHARSASRAQSLSQDPVEPKLESPKI